MLIAGLLKEKGLLSPEKTQDVEKALEKGENEIEAILRVGGITEQALYYAMSTAFGLDVVDLNTEEIDRNLVKMVPARIAVNSRVLPIKAVNGHVLVAFQDPFRSDVLDDLHSILEKPIKKVLAPPSQLQKLFRKFYGIGAEDINTLAGEDSGVAILSDEIVETEEEIKGEEGAESAAIVKFVNKLIIEAIRERASDIHIEPFENELRIRYRIDGVLQKVSVPAALHKLHAAIIARIKIMSTLDIAERRLPQDGRIRVRSGGKEIDIRVSIIPSLHGEGAVLRILDRESILLDMEELGMPKELYAEFTRIISLPHGMVLVTGPTGSGKTTTLYAALEKINSPEDKIITIEDPVEYRLPGVKQIQVNAQIGLTFANGLRSILRHDPDIVMVGEIRDKETLEIAIQASLTGHVVFSTVHTNDSISAITRLVDMGAEPYLVAATMEGIMAQRLVRRLCKNCKNPMHLDRTGPLKNIIPDDIKTIHVGAGCESCRGTGFRGRISVFELVTVSDEVRDLISRAEPLSVIKKAVYARGFKNLREAAWDMVRQGITTPEEVVRSTKID